MGRISAAKAVGFGFVQHLKHRQGQWLWWESWPCLVFYCFKDEISPSQSVPCSALNLLLKWSGREAPGNGNSQCQLWDPSASCAPGGPLGSHSWNAPCLAPSGIFHLCECCWLGSESEKCKKLFAHQSQEHDDRFWIVSQLQDSWTGQGKQLPPGSCRAPNPWIPRRDIETPTQGTLGVALDGHGFVAELLHVFSTGLLSRRPKIFK